MPKTIHLRQLLDFREFPADWHVRTVSGDWNGEPMLLFTEGASFYSGQGAAPRALHVVYFENGERKIMSLAGAEPWTSRVQRFEDGWLLAGFGTADLCNHVGQKLSTIEIGAKHEDVQCTPDGHIWVSYFDEGVFGNGVGQAGLACFDKAGRVLFRFSEMAEEHGIPYIADCYTLNVTEESAFISYYTDFPLVEIRDLRLHRFWPEFGHNKAVAIGNGHCLRLRYAPLDGLLVSLEDMGRTEIVLRMPNGELLSQGTRVDDPATYRFRVTARGARAYVYDDSAMYEIPWTNKAG